MTGAPASVPFGLLAVVQLLSATALLAVGIAGVWPRVRARASALLVAAVVVLAVPEVFSGFRFGDPTSSLLTGIRVAGALLFAGALDAGALRLDRASAPDPAADPAPDSPPDPGPNSGPDPGPNSGAGPGRPSRVAVLAPLGAAAPVAYLAAAAFAVAAVLAATGRTRPLRLRLPLAAALLLFGIAELFAPAARSDSAAATRLLLTRGLAALLLLAVLVVLVRESVLGRVAAVIFTAVLLTATGAVAVAGTVATSTLEREQSDTASRLHTQAQVELDGQVRTVIAAAGRAAACPTGPAGCRTPAEQQETVFTTAGGRLGRVAGPDDPVAAADLARVPGVGAALRASLPRGPLFARPSGTLAVLTGRPDQLVSVGVAPSADGGSPSAVVLVAPVDLHRLVAARNADLSVVVLPGPTTVASTFPAALQSRLSGLLAADEGHVRDSHPETPAVVVGLRNRGRAAASPLAPVATSSPALPTAGSPVAQAPTAVLVAASRDDGLVRTERRVLGALFLALVATAVLVGLLGVGLGAGVVRPIRRVTDAARRVRSGDLRASAGPGGADELGELARVFDGMTGSLADTQDELRRTADREAALRARLSTVVDSLVDGLLVLDDDDRITSSNPAARRLLGVDPVGSRVGAVLPVAAEAMPNGPELDALVGDAGSAEARYLSVRRTPLTQGGGTVVLVRDRTREHEAERMKTQFLANVSHELRTPLTPVRGYADLLRRRRAAGPDEVARHAEAIATAADRLGRVVDLLVDVAALDAGRVSPEVAPVEVTAFLDEHLAAWRSRQPERSADLRCDAADRLPPALVNKRWLGKAVDELIDNALKYAPAGSPVVLEAARHGDRVRVAVSDAGPGLDAAARAALYDDFAQADGSVTRAQDGLGLGLPFVRRVAALFDLELVVRSAPGAGATFGLDLPLAPRPVPQRRQRPVGDAERGPGTTSA